MGNKIGFIGAGNVAEAIIKGMRTAGNKAEIRVVNRSDKDKLKHLAEAYAVVPSTLEELIEESNIIFLAVKPKDFISMLIGLSSFSLTNKLFISVAAGIKLATIESYLRDVAVIRVMPNTSSAALYSMTGMVKGSQATKENCESVECIFSSIGKVMWIPETQMNALIGISGSGPAYFYLFTESLIQSGLKLGFNHTEAELLAKETLIGVAKMLEGSGKSPGRLREEVTSPNGTTEAALKVFGQGGLPELVFQAALAALTRAEEMEGAYKA